MKLKKETEELSFTYNTVLLTFDAGPTAATAGLKDFFSVREDRYITELRIAGKTLLDPADEVFLYAELIELYEKHGITTRERLCRVPFVMTAEDRPFVKLPPFVMRQDRTYLIDIRIMSATVDLNGAGGLPARQMIYVAEMLYDTKPIDFSQLPPYRCEVPVWTFENEKINSTGAAANIDLNFYFNNLYKVINYGSSAAASTEQRLYLEDGIRGARLVRRSSQPWLLAAEATLELLIDENVRYRGNGVPDTNTQHAYMKVQLVPVIP